MANWWVNVVAVPTTPSTRPPLDPDRLAALLGDPARAAAAGWSVRLLDQAGSTNAELGALARGGAPEGTVVATEHQTAGRGRLDRTWITPPRGALTFSVLLRPAVPPAAWPWLPLLVGTAVAAALPAHGVPAVLKWPNDVLVEEPGGPGGPGGLSKLAGILVERVDTPDGPAAVVGCGLNTDLDREELPVPSATSVRLVTGSAADRTLLLADLLASLAGRYDAWTAPGGADALHAAYSRACSTLGRDVRVELPAGGLLTGRATGIDTGGGLVVEALAGRVVVGAGDVVHVRPA